MEVQADVERVIVHFDIDCFYCQVEEINNPLLAGRPLGVTQKYLVVTSNYAARALGVTKLMSISDAKAILPSITLVNGEDLTPYRAASKCVLNVLKRYGPVSKLGLDEAFVDITAQVESRLSEATLVSNDLKWHGHVHKVGESMLVQDNRHRVQDLRALHEKTESMPRVSEDDSWISNHNNPPWVNRLKIGSAIAAEIRQAIYLETKLKTSAGIACNRMLAKLTSGLHKPNDQTILIPPEAAAFVAPLPVRALSGIGYKLEVELKTINVVQVSDLLSFDEATLTAKFGNTTGLFLYWACRGKDNTAVVPQGPPKSITVEDSFKAIKGLPAAFAVLKALAPDLLCRLEEDMVENNRKPGLLTLKWRLKGQGWKRTSASKPMPALPSLSTFSSLSKQDQQNAALALATSAGELLKQNVVDPNTEFSLLNIGATNFVDCVSGGTEVQTLLHQFIKQPATDITEEENVADMGLIEFRGHAPRPSGTIPTSKRQERSTREARFPSNINNTNTQQQQAPPPLRVDMFDGNRNDVEHDDIFDDIGADENLWDDLASVSNWKTSSFRPASNATMHNKASLQRATSNTQLPLAAGNGSAQRERFIIHLDIDSFYVSVERRDFPDLLNVPLAVEQFNSGGFVAVSYEAKAMGIRCGDGAGAAGRANVPHLKAMKARSIVECKHACPGLQVRPMRPDRYRQVSHEIEILLQDFLSTLTGSGNQGAVCPVERASCDDFYIDVTPLCASAEPTGDLLLHQLIQESIADKDFTAQTKLPGNTRVLRAKRANQTNQSLQPGMYRATWIAHLLRQELKTKVNMVASCGVANNKLMARLASPASKPDGLTVYENQEAAVEYIKNIPLLKIPGFRRKLGDEITKALDVNVVGDLSRCSRTNLVERFGPAVGHTLADFPLALDPFSEVKPRGPQKTLLVERSFPPASTKDTVHPILHELSTSLVNRLHTEPQFAGRQPSKFTVSWRQGYDTNLRSKSGAVPSVVIRNNATTEQDTMVAAIFTAAMEILTSTQALGPLHSTWQLTRLALTFGFSEESEPPQQRQQRVIAEYLGAPDINSKPEAHLVQPAVAGTSSRAAATQKTGPAPSYRNTEAQALQQMFSDPSEHVLMNQSSLHELTNEQDKASFELALKLQQEEALQAASERQNQQTKGTTIRNSKRSAGPMDVFLKGKRPKK